jgi:hypothetical protein
LGKQITIDMKQNLPTLADLYNGVDTYQKTDQFNYLMNENPPEKWVKVHPYIANYKYLPIDKVEYLLRKIFKQYKIEVLSHTMLLNSVSVHVRVHYVHPITGEWQYHDGVGAQEVQTSKGSGHLKLDMSNINKGAIMMALPIAKTIAIKDACDHFGRLFGSDLNRKDLAANSMDKNLQELTPDTSKWDAARAGLEAGTITIEQLQTKYQISDENIKRLQD